MVMACERLFCLDGRPGNLHTFSKVNLKYTKCTFPVGQARCIFTCPTAIIYKFYLPGAMGQAPMSSPGLLLNFKSKMYFRDNKSSAEVWSIYRSYRPHKP